MEKNKYYILWVCVGSLRYPACTAHTPHCHLWPAQLHNILPHYLINRTIKKKKLLNIKFVKRENQQDATNSMFIIKLSNSTCFRHHYAHHQENKTVSYSMRCSVWVCRLWSCGAASWESSRRSSTEGRTPHALGHGLILLMMSIMMPETCWDRKFDNKHRIGCILFFLSLFTSEIQSFKNKRNKLFRK